jgi:hypothetical protein
MNKKTKNITFAVAAIIVIVAIIWFSSRSSSSVQTPGVQNPLGQVTGSSTTPLQVSETTKVSGSSSQYQNAELGFSVQYPNAWEKDEVSNGVQFIMPIDPSQVSTVAKLEADITVSPGKCAFPPVTTVQDRSVLSVGNLTLNMISMANSVQNRSYFNRMYSLPHGDSCYFLVFSYIALSPDSKGLTGSNLTQAQNNNKAIKSTSDAAFTAMVKSFAFVAPPAGEDETKVNPR